MIKEFHERFSKTPDPLVPTVPGEDDIVLRANLIYEEFEEVLEEFKCYMDTSSDCHSFFHIKYDNYNLKDIDLHKVAKELADLLVVTYGTAAKFGIPMDEVFKEVHRSNMSKLGKDGKVKYREDGKILKSDNYQPADLTKVF